MHPENHFPNITKKIFWPSHLGLEVNIGGGHLGDLENAHGQRHGTQDEQTVVDQDPGQDCMPDLAITG